MDESEQACRGVHDKKCKPTEASERSWPSVSDGSDDDGVCGQNETETSKLSLPGFLASNLKLTKTLWSTCPKWIADTDQYFNLQSLLGMHQLSLAAVPI